MEIIGLDASVQKLRELGKAFSKLDGEIAKLSFNPQDPQSIDLAIQRINEEVDKRLDSCSNNEFLAKTAVELKEKLCKQVLEHATAARLNRDYD